MDNRGRIGRGRFFMEWAVVVAAQAAALGTLGAQSAAALGGVAALQLVKVPLCWRRLSDLGRPADDAMWTMVPLMNVGFWWQLMARTPSEALRERRIRSWSSQVTAIGAYQRAWKRMTGAAFGKTAVATLLSAVLLGLIHTTLADTVAARDVPREDSLYGEILGGVWLCLTLYFVMQWMKRRTASRASWWPVTWWLPVSFLWMAEAWRGVPMEGLGLIISGLPDVAFLMICNVTIVPALVVFWVLTLDDAQTDEPREELASRVRSRWMGVAAIYGGRDQFVEIGFQAVIPGVWLAISYAFADLVAILDPEKKAYATSSALVRGIRQRVFKMLTVGVMLTLALQLAAMSLFHAPGEIAALVVTPHLLSSEARMASDVVTVMVAWWCTAAMLVAYQDRAALWRAHHERDAGGDADASPTASASADSSDAAPA